ncbi:MAG: septum site-determining protein [Propionibacteriales bacterium]|nr:septum site-determining protein [Propionibacteriales bacterium]
MSSSESVRDRAPLLVTRDETLLDQLLRLTAAAGVTPEVVPDPGLLRPAWVGSSLVVVGPDLAVAVAQLALPRRDQVYVVLTEPDPAVYPVAVDIGVEKVLVLPQAEPWLRDRLADAADGARATGRTVCVVGGCGGAGASTFAAGLGAAAARAGLQVLLVDGDPLGGGLDLAVGSEDTIGVRWPTLMGTSGRVSAPSLKDALPAHGSLAVLSWDRGDLVSVPPTAVSGVVAAGRRGSDLVVVDLPRRLEASAQEALLAADITYLVLPAEVRAVAAAGRLARELVRYAARVEVVVRGPGPAGLDGAQVADSLRLPLAVEMRPDKGAVSDIDLGRGPWSRGRGQLARACRTVLRQQALVGRAAA